MAEVERLAKENAALLALMEERVRVPTALLGARGAGSGSPGWAHSWHPHCRLRSSQCGSWGLLAVSILCNCRRFPPPLRPTRPPARPLRPSPL